MTSTWTRRRLMTAVLFGTLGTGVVGAGAALLGFLYPRKPDDVIVLIASGDVPRAGEPPLTYRGGGFHLVNLLPAEGLLSDTSATAPGGLLVLSSKCTHLGCTANWNEDLRPAGEMSVVGAFGCPCHDSFFTKAGLKISGPAPRSLDTLALTVTNHGGVSVDRSSRRWGDANNPQRAVPWTPPP